ncbi:hypothetical protein OPQ81_006256 [Rhizoctonia solani]|nr:hypothetical protein OPQ81_006256 [Rhizoctonia solani]
MMQHPIAHELSSRPTFVPKLPGDILYLVACFSTFETRASLVRCNRWLHENCISLLFKDIYLHAPVQLFRLCVNEEAMRMLCRTDSIYLGEQLFSYDSWPSEVVEAVPDLVISVLGATNILTRLQVYSSDRPLATNYDFQDNFQHKLGLAASDPGFLPNLRIIIELPEHISLEDLCHGRPIIYYYHQVDPYMRADICPGFKEGGSTFDLKHKLSAHDVGILIRESQCISPNVYAGAGISVRMRFPGEKCAPVDPLSWTKTMLSASEIPIDELYSLEVIFEPNPPYQSATVQFATAEELHKDFPQLEDIKISYPRLHWSRSADHWGSGSEFLMDELPAWTPCPRETLMPHWMDWWLHAVELDSKKLQSHKEITETAAKLMDGLLSRWDADNAPNRQAMLNYLADNKHRSS